MYSFYSVLSLYENVAEQLCGICKVSKYTFYRTLKGKKGIKKKNKDGEQKVVKNKTLLEDFDKTAISMIILSFYRRPKHELPTLDKVHQEVSGIPRIKKTSRASMHRVIKKLGFVCKRSLFINHLGSSSGFFQDWRVLC